MESARSPMLSPARSPMLSAPKRQQMPEDDDAVLRRITSVIHDGSDFEGLVFEGGGTKGIFYAGAIKRLEDAGLLSQVRYFAGTSAGAQTAACLAFGHTGAEMQEMMRTTQWKYLLDGSGGPCGVCRGTVRLHHSYGYYKGDFMLNHLDVAFAEKRANGERNCTFREHYAEFGTELRLGVCNIVTGKFEFLDRHATPDMPVSLGVRASSSIPLAFVPVEFQGNVYVDGCFEGNLPISAFPDKRLLAFHLTSAATEHPMASCGAFLGSIADMLMHSSQRKNGLNFHSFTFDAQELRTEKAVDVIKINCGTHGLMETKLKLAEIDEMLEAGRNSVQRYLGLRSSYARSDTPGSLGHRSSREASDFPGALPKFEAPQGKPEEQSSPNNQDAMQEAFETVRLALSKGDATSGFDALRAIEAEFNNRDGCGRFSMPWKDGRISAATTASGYPSIPGRPSIDGRPSCVGSSSSFG